MLPKISLEKLSSNDLAEEYLNEIKILIKGTKWDYFDNGRILAMSMAGNYLRTSFDKELLRLLVEVFENLENSELVRASDDPVLVRSCAYSAIECALRKKTNERLAPRITLEKFQNGTLDLSIIQEAKEAIEYKNNPS